MFGFPVPDGYRRARDVLRSASYDADAIDRTLESVDWVTVGAMALPRYQRKVRDRTPHHTLIRLFLLGEAVSADDARQALRPMSLEQWVEAGLIRSPGADGTVCCAVRLTPVQDLVLAADNPLLELGEVPADFVMPPGGTSLMLAWSAIRRPVRRTLDLGTGSGYLGLAAAAFSDQVIATDCNPRAVSMAHFNSQLNQIERMESRSGDLWEPVAGEQFDLVLSNPPFVITPRRSLTFRDSGVRGDEFCRRLIREMPAHLEQDGFCQMLGNFAHRAGYAWREELAGWFSDLGCDALVLVTKRQPIDEYAMTWIVATESRDVAVVPQRFNEWMDYYEEQQIEQVSYLLVNLHRRSRPAHWTYVDDEPVSIMGACGDTIQSRFAILDYLAERPAVDALLDECLVLDSASRVVQAHLMTSSGPRVSENRLEMRGGLRYAAYLDARVLRMLVDCDGRQPLRSVLNQLAETLSVDITRVVGIAMPVVRQLLERGFLRPVQLVPQQPDA